MQLVARSSPHYMTKLNLFLLIGMQVLGPAVEVWMRGLANRVSKLVLNNLLL